MTDQPNLGKKQNFVTEKVSDFISRLGIVGELLVFLWRAKMWWLIPMVIALVVFAAFLALATAGPAGPMIYTLF